MPAPIPTVGIILIAHAAATLYMTGLIWFVQVVHYPLMAAVGREGFAAYESAHARLTTFVVAPGMLVEALCAGLLVLGLFEAGLPADRTPDRLTYWLILLGAAALLLVWATTFLVSVPLHGKLSAGFDARAHALLVNTNWIRTFLWSSRAAIACTLLYHWRTSHP